MSTRTPVRSAAPFDPRSRAGWPAATRESSSRLEMIRSCASALCSIASSDRPHRRLQLGEHAREESVPRPAGGLGRDAELALALERARELVLRALALVDVDAGADEADEHAV